MDKSEVSVVSNELKDPESLQRASTHDPRDLVKNWPTEASKAETYQHEWTAIAYDILLIILPLGLLAKAIVATIFRPQMRTDGNLDLVPNRIRALVALDDQLVTLFTIVFATILATLVRRIALWRAQRGASVVALEQLHASTSLPKAISSIWSLRAFSLTSVGLVVIWSWYYLGSQAAARELEFHDSASPYNLPMAFVSASAPSAFDEGLPSSRVLAKTNAGYLVKMGASGTHAMDISSGWDDSGEALIPVWDFEFAKVYANDSPHGGHGMEPDGWWDTDLPTYQVPTSAMGIPLIAVYNESGCKGSDCVRVTDQLIGHVRLNTSYIQANCSEISFAEGNSFHEITNTTAPTYNTIFNMTTNTTLPTILASREINGHTLTSYCNLTTTDIELEIQCSSQGCVTTRARPTPNQKLSVDFFYNSTLGQIFLDNMVAAIGAPAYDGEDFLQTANKMQTSRNTIDQALETENAAAALVLPASRGLTQIINSYLSASQQALINSIDYNAMISGVLGKSNATYTPVIMHGAPYAPQYCISLPWLIIDYVSCVVLLLCSIFAVVLRQCTFAPDVFGYVSSLTRDNPNIQLPDGGSILPGLERARKMKNVRVQFADTRHDDGKVGRVGLTVAEEGVGRLKKGAEYM